MEKVKFENGEFGVRKRFLFIFWWEYKDFQARFFDIWFSSKSVHFKDCKAPESVADKYIASQKKINPEVIK